MSAPRMVPVTSILPGSGRPFRIAVTEHAAGVWVAPRETDGEPFVAIVNHRIRSLDDAEGLASVARFVLGTGGSETGE